MSPTRQGHRLPRSATTLAAEEDRAPNARGGAERHGAESRHPVLGADTAGGWAERRRPDGGRRGPLSFVADRRVSARLFALVGLLFVLWVSCVAIGLTGLLGAKSNAAGSDRRFEQVRSAGVLDAPVHALFPARSPRLAEISPRQREILVRILEGQRVPTIARDLFLSASTVRNHLTFIFRRFGVHSQAELIEVLRRG